MQVEQRQTILNCPMEIKFHFGVNIQNRRRDGAFVYNANRLIRMYERSYPGSNTCNISFPGVVAVVNLPPTIIEPMHNKQNFAHGREYRYLLKVLYDFMTSYVTDIGYYKEDQNMFWQRYGYCLNNDWSRELEPRNEPEFVERRNKKLKIAVQCDKCLKWRVLPLGSLDLNERLSIDWECRMHPDPRQANCNAMTIGMDIQRGLIAHKKNEKDKEAPAKRSPSKKKVEVVPKKEIIAVKSEPRVSEQQIVDHKPEESANASNGETQSDYDDFLRKRDGLCSHLRLILKELVTAESPIKADQIDKMTAEELSELNTKEMLTVYTEAVRKNYVETVTAIKANKRRSKELDKEIERLIFNGLKKQHPWG
ncbi:hypothetical protein ACOME3_010556 [Neoechinorhynchus agilis]